MPPAISTRALMEDPAGFDYGKLAHPPVDLPPGEAQGRASASRRRAATSSSNGLNELIPGKHARPRHHRAGRPVQLADPRLQQLGLADAFGASDDPAAGAQRHLPAGARADRGLLRRQARRAGGRGRPARVHRAGDRHASCAGATSRPDCTARTCCPPAGEYTVEVLRSGLAAVRRAATLPEPADRVGQALARRQPRAPRGRGGAAGAAAAVAAAAASASAAPSGRCSRRSSWRSRTSGRCTSPPTSAATPSGPSSRSRWATRSWATA